MMTGVLNHCCHCGCVDCDPFLVQCYRTMDPIGSGAVDTPTHDAAYSPFTFPNGSIAVVSSNTWSVMNPTSYSTGTSEPSFGDPSNYPWSPMALSEVKDIVADNQGLFPVNDPAIDTVYFENSIRFKVTDVRQVFEFLESLDRIELSLDETLPTSSHLDESGNTTVGCLGRIQTPDIPVGEVPVYSIRAYQLRVDGSPFGSIQRRLHSNRSLLFDFDLDSTGIDINDAIIEIDIWVKIADLTDFTTISPGVSYTNSQTYPTFMTQLAYINGNAAVATPVPPQYFPVAKFNANNAAAGDSFHITLTSNFHGRSTFDDSTVSGWTREQTETTIKWSKDASDVYLLFDWTDEIARIITQEDSDDYTGKTRPVTYRRYCPPSNDYPSRSDAFQPGAWDHTSDVTFVIMGESVAWGAFEYRYNPTIDIAVTPITPTVSPGGAP